MESHDDTLTRLLQEASSGDKESFNRAFVLFQHHFWTMARGKLASARNEHTLEPTALVHEVYMRLLRSRRLEIRDRRHFLALVNQVMRQILISYERKRRSRVARGQRVPLDQAELSTSEGPVSDVLEELERLEASGERGQLMAEVFLLHVLHKRTINEIGELLELPPTKVKRLYADVRKLLRLRIEKSET